MSNIKPINQIPAQVFDTFDKAEPGYLVCGIVKTQTGQYQFTSFHVKNLDELYYQIAPEQLVRFKVFNVGAQSSEVEAQLKMKAKEFMQAKEKEARLKQYNELKKEFESLSLALETVN